MKKKVLLLAVSCKNGGLCPGGLDLSDLSKWIRIVSDDGCSGAVQGIDIDFAEPLDVIEFEGRHMPQGKQRENWVIDNRSCKRLGKARFENGQTTDLKLFEFAYKKYSYNGFWGNYKPYLTESEFEAVECPSESILKVSNVHMYNVERNKSKIDFTWSGAKYPIKMISMTDQDYYDVLKDRDIYYNEAYIVISIPKSIRDWQHPETGEWRAYKFVSKVFKIS